MAAPLTILVCGGGNGAQTLAGFASALPHVEVRVMTLFADEAEQWSNLLLDTDITISVSHNDGSTSEVRSKPKLITNDPSSAVPGVDAIFFVVPAFAHQQYFNAISPYLEPNTVIVGMPGQAGFEFQALNSLKHMDGKCAIVSLESLPWACRMVKFGTEVQVLGFKESLGSSLVTGTGKYKMEPLVLAQHILGPKPDLKRTHNYIAVNLMAKSIIHPPLMYGKWRNWDGTPLSEIPLFYQGVDNEQADLLSKISDEVVATAQKINKLRPELDMSEVIHIFDWYKLYYGSQISDTSCLRTAMLTNKAYDGLVYPMKAVEGGYVPDFSHRYTKEDIPFGLVVMKGIAQIAGVNTPTIDAIIQWAQQILEMEFLVGSALKGKDVSLSRAPQAYGFETLDALCNM